MLITIISFEESELDAEYWWQTIDEKTMLTIIHERFWNISRALGCEQTLPVTPQQDGRAHAELTDHTYFYVVTERGIELKRLQTQDPNELLSWFVRDLTAEIAGNWELKHRKPAQDSRRLRFEKHLELLREIDESWAQRQEVEYSEVLTKHPFDDTIGGGLSCCTSKLPMIDELITRMDRWLQRNRNDYYANLQPGAMEDAITAFERHFTVTLPQTFRKLYQWRNGQSVGEFRSFQENRMFLPLQDVAETKELLDEMIGDDCKDSQWWQPGWIPFLSNGSGDYLCLNVAAGDDGTVGQLIEFWHDDADRNVQFTSVDDWLQCLVESMENGTIELA
jgi:cell wall assembly regulator SMI1